MTFDELVKETKDLDLESKGLYLGKPANLPETISLFQDADEWVIQAITDRNRMFENRGKEEDMVRKMSGHIKLRMGGRD